jgi:DNA polymerase
VKYLPNRPARHRSAKASAGGGTPTSQDILHGKTHLDKQLKIISPKIVVLLGRVAAEGVLGNPPSPKGFGRARKVEVMKEHGKVIKEKEETRYFLTLHPAAAVKFVKFRKTIEEDFTKLKVILETY